MNIPIKHVIGTLALIGLVVAAGLSYTMITAYIEMDMVKQQLLKRVIPNSRTFDMIWDIKNSRIFFSSINEAVCTEFSELFKKTFDLNLELLFPYTIAQGAMTDEEKVLLENITPADFAK